MRFIGGALFLCAVVSMVLAILEGDQKRTLISAALAAASLGLAWVGQRRTTAAARWREENPHRQRGLDEKP